MSTVTVTTVVTTSLVDIGFCRDAFFLSYSCSTAILGAVLRCTVARGTEPLGCSWIHGSLDMTQEAFAGTRL
jgi:hypothetical protein